MERVEGAEGLGVFRMGPSGCHFYHIPLAGTTPDRKGGWEVAELRAQEKKEMAFAST